jgi:hypothetical protein
MDRFGSVLWLGVVYRRCCVTNRRSTRSLPRLLLDLQAQGRKTVQMSKHPARSFFLITVTLHE